MEAIPLGKTGKKISVDSKLGRYSVNVSANTRDLQTAISGEDLFFLCDSQIVNLYESELSSLLERGPKVEILADEKTKSIESIPLIVDEMINKGIKRGAKLVVIGGGITQDIGCFIATTLFRGLRWTFVPTTLLAQADSCIGSKSSINLLGHKNIVGTFYPPEEIFICPAFLDSLSEVEIRSGIGEMLKVHMLDSYDSFQLIAKSYNHLLCDRTVLADFIERSLLIKKRYIEEDEFDNGVRNLLNYGHSFGHAIEAATNFGIPHGIAITLGMDMANFISGEINLGNRDLFESSHPILKLNYHGYQCHPIDFEQFRSALQRDKKNKKQKLTLILPNKDNKLEKVFLDKTPEFWNYCQTYLGVVRT